MWQRRLNSWHTNFLRKPLKKDSPSDNDVYSYASDIAELVRTIAPVIEGVQANPPSFSKIPHFIKVENTVRGGRLQVCPNEFKS